MKNKRILWLLNHTTLRDFEVPLLQSMGYEVFVPKRTPQKVQAFRSGSVSHDYDPTLSLPEALLQEMNSFNFYESKWPRHLANAINHHFSSAIITGRIEMVNHVSEAFHGDLFIRKFGKIGELNSISDQIKSFCENHVYERMIHRQNIWIAYSYENLLEGEQKWLRDIGVYLPVGLPKPFFERQGTWIPVRDQVLFVCPEINTNPYYAEIYDEFITNFGKFPYIIPGEQSEKMTRNPHVTGFLPRADFDHLLQTCKVMYYHSRETYHLHYHPIEAMCTGMPVIYMAGGMLNVLAGEKLPGCCDTIAEAQEKINRVLDGDGEFIRQVIQSQFALVKLFSPAYTDEIWKKNFPPKLEKIPHPVPEVSTTGSDQKKMVVGFWMHETHPDGFTGEGITRLLAQLVRELQNNDEITILIACVSWVKQSIINYMTDLGVDGNRLQFITVHSDPPLVFSVYQWWKNRPKRKGTEKYNIHRIIRMIFKRFQNILLERVVVLRGLGGWLMLGISAILSTPIILGYFLYRLIKKGLTAIAGCLGWVAKKIFSRLPDFSERLHQMQREVYGLMVGTEIDRLVDKAGTRDDVDGWYISYPKMDMIKRLNRPAVIAVPDIVYLDFSVPYALEMPEIFDNHPAIENTIRSARSVITYSENVKDRHIVSRGYQKPTDVFVIHHAPINLRELITHHSAACDEEIRYRAKHIIREYLDDHPLDNSNQTRKYLQNLQYGEVDFFLVSSQTRPHKNHLNLLKAYEILLRKKYINAKLVLTGKLTPEMQDFLHEKRLKLDVISVNYLPAKVHAAFYACASLAIAPTLFEGGFPFVFSEALSLNTPAILSNIEPVREILSPEEQQVICFDPYSIDHMVEKVEWAYRSRNELLEFEKPIYNRLADRTWADVSKDYVRVFSQAFTDKDREDETLTVIPPMRQKIEPWKPKLERKICTIHIPKTAGTSFVSVLHTSLGNRNVQVIGWQEVFSEKKAEITEHLALTGHYPYEIQKLLAEEHDFITILRDPVERAISQYYQSKTFPPHWAYERLRSIDMDQYLDDPFLVSEISNVQTWMLGLIIDEQVESIRDLMNPREISHRVAEEMSRNRSNPVWPLGLYIGTPEYNPTSDSNVAKISPLRLVSLDLAKQRLAAFPFFGLTERFEDSLNLYTYTFNLPPLLEAPRKRAATNRIQKEDLSDQVMERIRLLNQMDLELYQFGEKLFTERYALMLEELRQQHGSGADTKNVYDLLLKRYQDRDRYTDDASLR